MKCLRTLLLLCLLAIGSFSLSRVDVAAGSIVRPSASVEQETKAQQNDKLVYADFETLKDGRPLSNRGGVIQLTAYSERPTLPSRYKGSGTTDAPELVRLKPDDPNRAMTFEFEMQATNQYAGVSVQVHGQADKDGKPVADDVSGYKYLTFQLYAKGVTSVGVELISKGQGIEANGYPQMSFKVVAGFNTYRFPLNSLNQQS